METKDKIEEMKVYVRSKIVEKMEQTGQSQAEVVRQTGVNRSDLSQIINGSIERYSLQKMLCFAYAVGLESSLELE